MEIAGRCQQYKSATKSVLNWLASQTKGACSIAKWPTCVDDIALAAKEVALKAISVPRHIYHDLSACIRLRTEVQKMYTCRAECRNEKDRRHHYFISALKEAREALKTMLDRDKTSEPSAHEATQAEESVHPNHFVELAPDTESEEEPPSPANGRHRNLEGLLVRMKGVGKKKRMGKLGIVQDVTDDVCSVFCHGEVLSVPVDDLDIVSEDDLAEIRGETISFQAASFLLDLEELHAEVISAWEEYTQGQLSLPAATAKTNVCVRQASAWAVSLELLQPELYSLERVIVAAYLLDVVQWAQDQLDTTFAKALGLAVQLVFGDPDETRVHTLGPNRILHGHMLAMARVKEPGGVELQRAGEGIRKRWPECSPLQAEQLIDVVSAECFRRFLCIRGLPGLATDADDFLVGANGLVHTSDFLLRLSNAGLMTPPKRWNFLKPDHFGPQWDEKKRPASCTSDLTSYSGMVIPALLWYAHYELRTSKTQQLRMPDLKFDSLMPLWSVLQKAMAAGRTSLSLAFAMHALMISTVKVNGEQRCMRIGVTCRACFSKFVSQLERDHEFYDHPSAAHNFALGKLWVDEAEKRMRSTPHGGEQDDLLKQIGCLQRDYALLLNPWVAGQQQLVALVAVAIGIGSSIVDSRGQIRFVLHLYNALRCAEVVQSLPMLDWLLEIFRSSKAIWHAGRPTEDFLQHWYLSLGMAVSSDRGSSLRGQRALVPVDAAEISPSYQRVANGDFRDLSDYARTLRGILQATSSSFEEDKLFRYNLFAVGAHFRQLPEKLVQALQLELKVLEEQGSRPDRGRPSKSKSKKDADASKDEATKRVDAVHVVLAGELFFACERSESVEKIAGKLGYKATPEARERPQDEKPQLQMAAQVLAEHVGALSKASYMLPS